MAFLGSFFLGLITIPRIIFIAKKKKLFDVPDNIRKFHKETIPNLGGIGIFFAFVIATALMIPSAMFAKWNYFTAASLILFLIGLKDDLISISPIKKFFFQFCAASIMVLFAHARITDLHGLFGVHELPFAVSIGFSIVGIVFITNAFNLLDGVDGLAGSIGVCVSGTFGLLLYGEGNYSAAIVAFSLAGAIAGFLRFNFSPARIFMGDSGSLVIGFSVAILGIYFINSYNPSSMLADLIHGNQGTLIIALAILFLPIFDTFRVFTTRSLKGLSPFNADRTHLHHYLLDLGCNHRQVVAILALSNFFIVLIALVMQDRSINFGLLTMLGAAFVLYGILFYLKYRSEKESMLIIRDASAKAKPVQLVKEKSAAKELVES